MLICYGKSTFKTVFPCAYKNFAAVTFSYANNSGHTGNVNVSFTMGCNAVPTITVTEFTLNDNSWYIVNEIYYMSIGY